MIDTLTKRLTRDAGGPESAAGAQIAEALAAADAEVPEYQHLVERLERDLRPREAGSSSAAATSSSA